MTPSRMSAAPSIVLPRTFGRYALFDFIGKGGMAEIYLARQKSQFGAARRCVVKQILPELASDSGYSDMLVHEAKLAAGLSHANVVQVFDLGREDGRLYIAMEYVEGFDLNELLRRCSRAKVPLPFELATHVVREALSGLDYAHRRTDDAGRPLGIVHLDVSPSNLLVSFEGEVKVCDFGIARANAAIGLAAAHHFDEVIKGKAGYMSPEQARGEPVDSRADVFAAGIVLWELAAGRRLYKEEPEEDGLTLIERARRAEIPELPELNLPLGDQLRRIVGKALSPQREARYPSAAAMQRDLHDYAIRAKLMASPLQLGDWLAKTFGEEIVARRRVRERAAQALERGAPIVVQPVGSDATADAAVARPSSRPTSPGTGLAPSESLPPKAVAPHEADAPAKRLPPTEPAPPASSAAGLAPEMRMPAPFHANTVAPPAMRAFARPQDRKFGRLVAVAILVLLGLAAAVVALAVR
jgi:serine/threonine protein kinase